jgi:enamine deaminase RidA (YjgF/YER057c/UK114 family)
MRKRWSSASPYESAMGFSRAVRQGSRILVSGTAPIGADGESVGIGDAAIQARRCLDLIMEAVVGLGGREQDVIRTRIYLTHASDWEAVGRVQGERCSSIRPAAACVIVSGLLRPEWRVEIEAEALIGDEP